ncbi:carbohydrate ABC transporter permease [Candidatus Haliotispira prima]|uniref:Carbohydrate ABC transporter permease n=1 Tax=Candidatus Haliotispira prima TaxID=3034016 RepID=A0ABY8MH94_9SPIO|nr:carbohydrate ABC transporter permease [Candidatus Haliotispira prima]
MKKGSVTSILAYVTLITGGLIFIFPFIWTLLSSFKSANEAIAVPLVWFPAVWSWANYAELFTLLPFGYFYWNTALLVFFRIVCAILFSTMAAYGFARIPFPGSKFFFALIVLQFMIPPAVFIYPQYRILFHLNALNTVFALVFPGLVSAFGTFLMRQAFLSLPGALEEASVIDGCSRWQIYTLVYLPLLKSFMVALSIFTMIFAWKDLMWPLIVNTDIKKMTLTAGIMYLQTGSDYIANYAVMMAGVAMATIPLVTLYFFFQKSFQTGIAMTGIK